MDSSSTDKSSPDIRSRKRKHSCPDPSPVKNEPAKKKRKVPGAKTPLSLDVGKVVFDGDAVEAGPEVQVKARHVKFGGHQPGRTDVA